MHDLRVMVLYGWQSNPYAESTIRALLAQNIKIDFVTRAGSEWSGREQACTIHPIFPGHRRERSRVRMLLLEMIALVRVLRLVLKTRPDIVHYQSYRMIRVDWILFLLLKLLGWKIVFTVHDTHSLEASRLDTFIFAETARLSDILLVHNEHARRVLIDRWKVRPDRIRIIPHGGYDQYYPRTVSKAEARTRLGYADEFLLLAFGTVREYKGLGYLLPAIAEIREQITSLRLLIAGRSFDPALGARYERQISDLGLTDIVRFENRFIETAEVNTFFMAADLVVLPYIRIDQSGVLFLAYTFGRPVLATSIGGLPELVREGLSGHLVKPADSRSLSEGILSLWAKRGRLAEMGANARRLIEEECTWERQADVTVAAYLHLLGGGVRPADVGGPGAAVRHTPRGRPDHGRPSSAP